tara:strand:+ start:17433 stop:17555 length:123 start_codon:yes stop_codon:yes gene_type:complete
LPTPEARYRVKRSPEKRRSIKRPPIKHPLIKRQVQEALGT